MRKPRESTLEDGLRAMEKKFVLQEFDIARLERRTERIEEFLCSLPRKLEHIATLVRNIYP